MVERENSAVHGKASGEGGGEGISQLSISDAVTRELKIVWLHGLPFRDVVLAISYFCDPKKKRHFLANQFFLRSVL